MKKSEKDKQQTPLFGTKEWSDYSVNCISGCSHDCVYCFAKSGAIRYAKRSGKTPSNWKDEVINASSLSKKFKKRDGKLFMFPSTHDVTPGTLAACIQLLIHLLAPGNDVVIVTKAHLDCVHALCKVFPLFKNNITYRITIGSSDSNTLSFWEPGAPDFDERLASLKYAYSKGYQTSVSCEPMLDDNVQDIIEQVLPYVTETVWIGKPNMLKNRLSLNGHKDNATRKRADNLLQSLSDQYIWGLYSMYRDDPRIRWKDSIQKVLRINASSMAGMNVYGV